MRCSEVQLDAAPHARTEEGLLFKVVVVDVVIVVVVVVVAVVAAAEVLWQLQKSSS